MFWVLNVVDFFFSFFFKFFIFFCRFWIFLVVWSLNFGDMGFIFVDICDICFVSLIIDDLVFLGVGGVEGLDVFKIFVVEK